MWATTNRVDVVRQVWDLTPTETRHRAHHPTYTLHTSFPVRRVLFRPGYECELAVVSNADFGTSTEFGHSTTSPGSAGLTPGAVTPRAITAHLGANGGGDGTATPGGRSKGEGSDPVEIWDVRRGYIAKWVVTGSAVEGGVTGSSVSLYQPDNDTETLSDRYRLRRLACAVGSAPVGDVLSAGLAPVSETSRRHHALRGFVEHLGFYSLCH